MFNSVSFLYLVIPMHPDDLLHVKMNVTLDQNRWICRVRAIQHRDLPISGCPSTLTYSTCPYACKVTYLVGRIVTQVFYGECYFVFETIAIIIFRGLIESMNVFP